MSDNDFSFSLADVRTAVSEQFKPCRIDLGDGNTATLIQSTRLEDDKLEKLMAMQGRFNELQKQVKSTQESEAAASITIDEVRAMKAESVTVLEDIIRLVAKTDGDADRLIESCNHDMFFLMEVFKRYSKKTQLGEASASSNNSDDTAGPSTPTSAPSTDSTSGE